LKDCKDKVYVATKAGRRLDPHVSSGYNRKNLTSFVNRSLKNLGVDTIDLLQLHCPPTEVYYRPEVFGILDDLSKAGKILHYGVSVEKVEEALKAIEFPNVKSVQLIYNIFRQRPSELFFGEALKKKVAILARVPLASGLLTGKMTKATTFESDDHRAFNRHGEAFDRGETFSGVDFETGLSAVEELRRLVPQGWTMTQFALRWILMSEAVSCAIPGAKNAQQAENNAKAADLPELGNVVMHKVSEIYNQKIRELVHHYW
jgi:aryl-alcohol dehydrogenase-like predicted oxidoreductase